MLALKSHCECCGDALSPQVKGAFICSYECTFCQSCVKNTLHYQCPNCGGELVARPVRKKVDQSTGAEADQV